MAVLDDTNAQSMVDQIANGSAGDLMNQLSTRPCRRGRVQPLCGRIDTQDPGLAAYGTFPYIPALALPTDDTLNLRLNVRVFRDPKSWWWWRCRDRAKAPPLHREPAENFCALKPSLTLPAEGAALCLPPSCSQPYIAYRAAGGRSMCRWLRMRQRRLCSHMPLLRCLEGFDGCAARKYGSTTGRPRFHVHAPQRKVDAGWRRPVALWWAQDTLHLETTTQFAWTG